MSGFSDDGQWWWDGRQWIATSQVEIPDMGPPEVPESVLREASHFNAIAEASSVSFSPLPDIVQWTGAVLALWNLLVHRRTYRVLRQLKLAQLAQAAAYLLGPGDPTLAAEASLYPINPLVVWTAVGRLSVIVTKARVLVVEGGAVLDPPRQVVMAARPGEIQMDTGRAGLFRDPALFVRRGANVWTITGTRGVLQPRPVIDAWWRARSGVAP